MHSVRGVWTEDGVLIMEQTLVRNKNKDKTRIDWDLNIYCPEQWYGEESTWDPELWVINPRMYNHIMTVDTDYSLTLLPKEAKALGLLQHGKASQKRPDQIFDDWLDASLDGFIDLHGFNEMYRSKCSNRVLEFLDGLPQYVEDVPARMRY